MLFTLIHCLLFELAYSNPDLVLLLWNLVWKSLFTNNFSVTSNNDEERSRGWHQITTTREKGRKLSIDFKSYILQYINIPYPEFSGLAVSICNTVDVVLILAKISTIFKYIWSIFVDLLPFAMTNNLFFLSIHNSYVTVNNV